MYFSVTFKCFVQPVMTCYKLIHWQKKLHTKYEIRLGNWPDCLIVFLSLWWYEHARLTHRKRLSAIQIAISKERRQESLKLTTTTKKKSILKIFSFVILFSVSGTFEQAACYNRRTHLKICLIITSHIVTILNSVITHSAHIGQADHHTDLSSVCLC